jgi:alkyldihydroxyacetonephosphate synthase
MAPRPREPRPRRRSHWAWGHEDELAAGEELAATAALIAEATGLGDPTATAADLREPVPLERARLAEPRLAPPPALAAICSTRRHDRAVHTYGQAYRDLVRAFHGAFEHPPDTVAYPRDERDLEVVLAWAERANAAVIPYGGGTSVVGGVEPRVDGRHDGVITVDLSRMDRVLEVDPVSRAARIQAGASGPALNRRLAEYGLTLRHFPQSYEFSTLGGWIATRAGGHFATGPTHIDDLVESVRALTPRGAWQSRRLPGSGAGISPDRMLLGSEGTLGVITEAWVRLLARPRFKAGAAVRFGSFAAGADAVREIAQAELYPANCRLIDATEARLNAGGDGWHALLVLGFESADHPVTGALERALELAAGHGGEWDAVRAGPPGGRSDGEAGADRAWRGSFLRMPYLRNALPAMGLLSETFETAVTWDRFAGLHEAVTGATEDAVRAVCGGGIVTCRFAFTYPDGPAPYYTVLAPARRGEEVAQWDAIKGAAAEAILAAGGTITHHHAVGRDHRPWYDRQRPDPFAAALRGAKAAVDPAGILNPGVLLDP